MSIIAETIEAIRTRTGLVNKGRNFSAQIDSVNSVRFEVTAKALNVFTHNKKGGKEGMVQVVALDKAASYIHGYLFSYGFISKRGEKITSSMQLKRENAMTTKSTTAKKDIEAKAKKAVKNHDAKPAPAKKAKPAKEKAPAVEHGHHVPYNLGKPVDKAARTALIKQLKHDHGHPMKLATALRELILAKWDNDACVDGATRLTDEFEVTHSDVNKVRRALRRKGMWK